jgi:ABC-type polysaccharide/polyol phosphate export permease
LVVRDLKIKYRGSVFGYLWSLLEPLSSVAIYYFLFVVLAKTGGREFVLIVLLGILPWNFFSGVVHASTNALRANADLVLRIALPREIYVIAAAASQLVVLTLSMLVAIPMLFVFDSSVGPLLLAWPIAILLIACIAVGIGLFVACANAIYRDVGYLVGVLLRMGLYASAAVYPVALVPEKVREVFLLNPMAVLIELARGAVLGNTGSLAPRHLAWSAGCAALVLMAGVRLFPRLERRAVKFL